MFLCSTIAHTFFSLYGNVNLRRIEKPSVCGVTFLLHKICKEMAISHAFDSDFFLTNTQPLSKSISQKVSYYTLNSNQQLLIVRKVCYSNNEFHACMYLPKLFEYKFKYSNNLNENL